MYSSFHQVSFFLLRSRWNVPDVGVWKDSLLLKMDPYSAKISGFGSSHKEAYHSREQGGVQILVHLVQIPLQC